MSLAIRCGKCDKEYKVNESLAGKWLKCARCATPIEVAAPARVAAAASTAADPPPLADLFSAEFGLDSPSADPLAARAFAGSSGGPLSSRPLGKKLGKPVGRQTPQRAKRRATHDNQKPLWYSVGVGAVVLLLFAGRVWLKWNWRAGRDDGSSVVADGQPLPSLQLVETAVNSDYALKLPTGYSPLQLPAPVASRLQEFGLEFHAWSRIFDEQSVGVFKVIIGMPRQGVSLDQELTDGIATLPSNDPGAQIGDLTSPEATQLCGHEARRSYFTMSKPGITLYGVMYITALGEDLVCALHLCTGDRSSVMFQEGEMTCATLRATTPAVPVVAPTAAPATTPRLPPHERLRAPRLRHLQGRAAD